MIRKILCVFLLNYVLGSAALFAEMPDLEEGFMERADEYDSGVKIRIVETVKLPAGYHEGIFMKDGRMLVNNGEGGMTWIVDTGTGDVTGEITPVATFTEGMTIDKNGRYWVTDWDTKKLYRVHLDDHRMVPELEVSLAPAHPTGVIWNGNMLYVLTWTRGIGTDYHLLEIDLDGRIHKKIKVRRIHEPSQLAWDGDFLWVSSWYSQRIYRIDIEKMGVTGHIKSPVDDTTGILWDNGYLWVTGTKSDLYKVELIPGIKDK